MWSHLRETGNASNATQPQHTPNATSNTTHTAAQPTTTTTATDDTTNTTTTVDRSNMSKQESFKLTQDEIYYKNILSEVNNLKMENIDDSLLQSGASALFADLSDTDEKDDKQNTSPSASTSASNSNSVNANDKDLNVIRNASADVSADVSAKDESPNHPQQDQSTSSTSSSNSTSYHSTTCDTEEQNMIIDNNDDANSKSITVQQSTSSHNNMKDVNLNDNTPNDTATHNNTTIIKDKDNFKIEFQISKHDTPNETQHPSELQMESTQTIPSNAIDTNPPSRMETESPVENASSSSLPIQIKPSESNEEALAAFETVMETTTKLTNDDGATGTKHEIETNQSSSTSQQQDSTSQLQHPQEHPNEHPNERPNEHPNVQR